MKKIILRNLNINDYEQFNKILNENWEKNFDFLHYWESLGNKDFEYFIKIVPEFSIGKHLPVGHVPCTFLFAFNENDELVGRTSIRHTLTEHLLMVGGHIGYGVAPSFRRMGYATLILKESLNWIRINIPELKKVLVTCDEENLGSRRTIENNGGVLENILQHSGVNKMRYWIHL